ncbi:MAG: tRNA uridine-5-carboxymethylaminomethyl(34) synthesis GTPase MnmE [Desulfobacteraceae bacterium]|nr:tRNA uridine-5-carboxymethylaminomethyl(34) synthesis GTPase MnmE [Desulfobacteraceae bacterium]
MDRSTIAAIATPEGTGGIGIIKISGPDALNLANAVFRRSPGSGESDGSGSGDTGFRSWRMYFGHICVPETGRILDEVVLAVMRAPHSYTREDVVEIQAHAGPRVLHNILDLLVSRGIRLAGPGEFTRRAFVNGRIDLTQAEAVADLINATSDAAVDMAVSQVSGELKAYLDSVRQALLSVLSSLEAGIDFPDAVDEADIGPGAQARILQDAALVPLRELIQSYEAGHFLRDGLQAVIVGGPNVGKSSLMNCLVNRNRSIVTEIPGTTRDCIEVSFINQGVPLTLADTAGLRENPEPVERLGIEKTREYLATADIVLFVVDAGSPVRSGDRRLFDELAQTGKRVILVVNKSDLAQPDRRFDLPAGWAESPCVYVSALYGNGIDQLRQRIADCSLCSVDPQNRRFIPNWRQKALLDQALQAVSDGVDRLCDRISFELASIDLREALSCLDEITGHYVAPDVLDRIFNQHCVGK